MQATEEKTQEQQVLEYLETGKSLTRLECLRLFQSIELPRIIHDLKAGGHDIKTEIVQDLNTGKRYAEYFIMQKESLF